MAKLAAKPKPVKQFTPPVRKATPPKAIGVTGSVKPAPSKNVNISRPAPNQGRSVGKSKPAKAPQFRSSPPSGRKPGDRPGGQKRSDLGTQTIGTASRSRPRSRTKRS